MPNTQGINYSQLMAPELLSELVVAEPILSFAGKIAEATWKQKRYGIDRSIDVPKRNFFIAEQGLTANDATLIEDFVNVPVQEPLHLMFPMDVYDEMFNYGSPKGKPQFSLDFKERIIIPAATSVGVLAAKKIMTELDTNMYMTVGTAGTPLSSIANFGPVDALWTRMGLPEATPRMAVLSPENYSALGSSFTTLLNPGYTSQVFRELNIPMVFGFGAYKSSFVTKHIFGTAAAGSVTVNTTMTEGSTTLILTVPASSTIKAGDLFSIANVNHVSPWVYEDYGQLMGFVANVDASVAGTTATVTLSTPIHATGPRKNVTALPQSGAAVTFKAVNQGGQYVCTKNYIIFKDSLSVTSLIIPEIYGADNGYARYTKAQMQMKVTYQGQIQTLVNRMRLDLALVWRAFADYGIVLIS